MRFALPILATIAIAILIAAPTPRAAQTDDPEASAESISEGGGCSPIHEQLTRLARAERDQAFALELFSGGGQVAIIETRYLRLQQASRDLREVLRRVHSSRLRNDPSVAECLKLGYQSLFSAEKVSGEVEKILVKAHGEPLVRLNDGNPDHH